MGSLARPRGRLPARVYWFRRGLVLVTALALVFAVGRLLGGGQQQAPEAASPAAHETRAGNPSVPAQSSTSRPTPQFIGPVAVAPKKKSAKHAKPGKKRTPSATPSVQLAQPTGPCDPADITVRAALDQRHAGSRMTIPLELTGTQAACTFRFSHRSVVVKLVSGSDRIWSSQQCPQALRPRNIVVRSAAPTKVSFSWSGKRSSEGCPTGNAWAMPGWYHAVTAALGSEPSDKQFQLTVPPRAVVTKTAQPKPKKG